MFIHVSKYPPNTIFRSANINAQRANVTGSMNWHNKTFYCVQLVISRLSNRPALGGTVPLWGKMSRVPRRPCAGRILSRFGQKSDVCDCAPHMSHAECTIVHMSEHENRTGRYTTKDRARRATKHAYTCTHDTVPMPKSDGMGTRTA